MTLKNTSVHRKATPKHANVFADTARATAAYRLEVSDKEILMAPEAFREWKLWHGPKTLHRYIAAPLLRMSMAKSELETLRDGSLNTDYYIDIAHKLYDDLGTKARMGWGAVFAATDIRRLPPSLVHDEAVQQDARLAAPTIQAGLAEFTHAGLLPEVEVSFTGHMPHEKYFWASTSRVVE